MSLKNGKSQSILKVGQRGNASLEKEYETLLKLRKSSEIYKNYIPETYKNKKINSSLLNNKFYFFQKYMHGSTLSKLIQTKKIKTDKAKSSSEVLVNKLIDITREDLKNSVNQKPSEIFR